MSTMSQPLPTNVTPSGQPHTLRILWRCYGFLRPYWLLAVGAYLSMLVNSGLNLITPQLTRQIIDYGIGERNLAVLRWAVLALLGLTLVKGVLGFFRGRWSEVASQSVAYDLRNELQRKLTLLSFSYHDQTETGELLSRTIQDVDRVRFLTGRALIRVVDSVVMLVGTAALLVWMNPRLALLVIATMPFLAHRALSFGSVFRPLSLSVQKQLAVLTTRLEQSLRGIRVVKAFAQERAEIERFDKENERWFSLTSRAARLEATNVPLMNLIANFGAIFILWYGGRLVIGGQLTLGELVAFTLYLGQVIQPVRELGQLIPAVAIASAAAQRIFEVLDTATEVRDAPEAVPLPPVKGHVCFENVSFAYGRHGVLKDISFEARPGQVIALLGRTGSGKSTIINLIPRFYDATAGRITIDGHATSQVTLSSLRSQIGSVLQETTLFAATIRENIAFGRPGATQDEIVAAARAAQAHSFIMQMPQGYDTYVGERGVTLSGGQKQRVAIARALLTDPRILILDDATSSVDAETERAIQLALERVMQGRTTFVIAHRLSTVRRADLILVLDKGRIAARGTHQALLKTSPLYAEIYRQQLKPQEKEHPISNDTA
jgi:ATP-binding cassette subfamily B multidrug efflux pump